MSGGGQPWRRRLGPVLAALVAALALGLGVRAAAGSPAGPASTAAGPVVIVGVPGLRWDDVTPTAMPTLWRLLDPAHQTAAVGALSVRAASPLTCPADGWVTLGAGDRARAPGHCPTGLRVRPGSPPGGATVVGYATVLAANRDVPNQPEVGLLARRLRAAGRCVAAVGPGAALAAADPTGQVSAYAAELATAGPAFFGRCPVTVVDPQTPISGSGAVRARGASAADRGLASVLADAPAGRTLLVAGSSDTSGDSAHLHVALAVGTAPDGSQYRGQLSSASTGRPPYVQLIDVAPTALALVGVDPGPAASGQPWQPSGAAPASTPGGIVSALVDLDRHARAAGAALTTFFGTLVGVQLGVYALVVLLAWRQRRANRPRTRLIRAVTVVALFFAALPVATYLANLAPWWRAGSPLAASFGLAAAWALVIVGLAGVGPWRRRLLGPAGAIAAATAAVLIGDLVTGGQLQMSSLAGYSPLVAGRFAGVGNVAFGILATGALLAGAAAADRLVPARAALVVTAVGVVTVAVDGIPGWGSDFGGVLALVPGFAVLGMLACRVRVSVVKLAVSALAAVLVVAAFAVADYLRPPDARTHLGRFVGQLLDGTAGAVIDRKAGANLALLTHAWYTLLLPAGVVLVLAVLGWPQRLRVRGLALAYQRAPTWRAGLVALAVTALVGAVVNDSGVAIPAVAIIVAGPLGIAVSARALAQADRADPAAPSAGQPDTAAPAQTPEHERGRC